MELFYALIRTYLKLAAYILSTLVLGKVALVALDYDVSTSSFYAFSALAGLSFHLLESFVIYPYFLDPLRNLPWIKTNDGQELNPVKYGTRGEKTLQWVRDNPGADMLRVSFFPGYYELLAVSANAYRDVLVTNSNHFMRPLAGQNFLRRMLGYGLITTDGAVHKHQRKHLDPAFKVQNIHALYPLILDKTAIFLDQMMADAKSNGDVEISSWASRLTMDIIGPAVISTDFRSLNTPNHPMEQAFSTLLKQSVGHAVIFIAALFMPSALFTRLPIPTNRMIDRTTDTVYSICDQILREKTSTSTGTIQDIDKTDILHKLITSGEFTHTEILDQMVNFVGAGHETTAATISWVTHLLTLPKYMHYQAILRKEVRDALSPLPSSPLRFDPHDEGARHTLETLPYLNGICEEALRLYPPVTTTARIATADTTVAGHRVPRHAIVVLSPWATNRNPEFWGADAGEMVPERWIDEVVPGGGGGVGVGGGDARGGGKGRRLNKNGGARSNFHLETFLHGHHSCIGRDLAKAELRCAIAAMFGRFEVRRLPGDDGSGVHAGGMLTIKPVGGLRVTLKEAD